MAITQQDLQAMLRNNDQLEITQDTDVLSTKTVFIKGAVPAAPTKQNDPWTETERRFALAYLQPAMERGEYLWYMAQVTVYMHGQTYTFDFVALRPDGGADHFEVKGTYKLGSQDRSSVKARWAASYIASADSPHRVFWAREKKEGGWRVKEIKLKTQIHPIAVDL